MIHRQAGHPFVAAAYLRSSYGYPDQQQSAADMRLARRRSAVAVPRHTVPWG